MTLGRSGRGGIDETTIAYRSLINCTIDPGGYTPIMRMNAPSTTASNFTLSWAKMTDNASCGVSASIPLAGLHILS